MLVRPVQVRNAFVCVSERPHSFQSSPKDRTNYVRRFLELLDLYSDVQSYSRDDTKGPGQGLTLRVSLDSQFHLGNRYIKFDTLGQPPDRARILWRNLN